MKTVTDTGNLQAGVDIETKYAIFNDIELMYILHSKEHWAINNRKIYAENLLNSARTVKKKTHQIYRELDAIK